MNSFVESIARIIDRDLTVLEKELELYSQEENIWKTNEGIKNSTGNLTLHLCGNLQHYIGSVLGHSGYVRNRDNEFAAKGLTRTELLEEIHRTKRSVNAALSSLEVKALAKPYPENVFKVPMTTEHFLIHLVAHLGYHLGQVNYHRRLL